MYTLLVLFLNIGYFLLIKLLQQRGFLNQFNARKVLHLGSALGALWAITVLTQQAYVFLCLFFFAFYTLLKWKKLLRCIEERSFHSIGVPLYPIGLALMGLFLWDVQIQHMAGILLLGIPDSLGAWIEQYPPKHWLTPKLWKLFMYSSLSLSILIWILPIWWAFLIAGIVTAVEHISKHGWDNVSVPAVYTASLLFLAAI